MRTSKAGTCSKEEVGTVPGRNGFTLLELIVVIFILALFLGLVMPSFHGLGSGRLKSDAGKIASLLRYLNDSSVSRKETIPLSFNLDDKALRWKSTEGERSEKYENLSSVSATSTGNVSKGEVIVFFSPTGLQESLIVGLKDGDKEMTVSFNPLSGRAKIVVSNQ